jgi:tetratricopeptide (TPR) repeat protein
VQERAALFRGRLSGSRVLIVLDNAATEAQIRPLLPGAGGCLVLVTSRRRLKGLDEASVISLGVLPSPDALMLLRTVIGDTRAEAPEEVLAEIAALCGCLPLALRIAAALLRHRPTWSLEHLAGLLREQHHRVGALTDGERDLRTVFDVTYRTLSATHQQFFRRLGLVPGPEVDTFAAAALTDTDPHAAVLLLEDLVDHNLLIPHATDRYRMHDLIRLHARDLASHDTTQDRDAPLGRLLDFYQHTAGRAESLIARQPTPGPGGPGPAHAPALPDADAAWAWLRAERPNLLAALDHTTAHGMPARAIALICHVATLLFVDGPWSLAVDLFSTAIAAADVLGDQPNHARLLGLRADVLAATGDFSGSLGDLREALGLFQDLGDRTWQANVLTRLGQVRAWTGDTPAGIRDLHEALELFRDLGTALGQANALLVLGQVRGMAGDLPAALGDLHQALGLFQELEDRRVQAIALTRLATIKRRAGDYTGAITDLREAVQVNQARADLCGQAIALALLGDVHGLVGDHDQALRDLNQALDLFRQLGELLGQANTLTMLGRLHGRTGDHTTALRNLRQGLELLEQTGARGFTAWALNSYATEIAATGDTAQALALHHEALNTARETHQSDDEAGALEGIGACHAHLGDTETAATHLKKALRIYQHLSMTPDAHRVHVQLDHLTATGNPA